jgi:hypothetical protein
MRRERPSGSRRSCSHGLKVVGSEPAEPEDDARSVLDDIVREGARRMLLAALEAEVATPAATDGLDRPQ